MNKIDLKKEIPTYTARSGRFDDVDLPPMRYLAIDGTGDPNTSPAYADALATLYPVAYALKFASRRELDRDYVVPPLEALWWADDLAAFTTARDKSAWSWTAMILVPDWIDDAPAIELLRVLHLDEGRCVQTLHVGSYDDEGPVLERLHDEAIAQRGLQPTGRHHEIYLSDARRTARAKLRTILRQSVTDT